MQRETKGLTQGEWRKTSNNTTEPESLVQRWCLKWNSVLLLLRVWVQTVNPIPGINIDEVERKGGKRSFFFFVPPCGMWIPQNCLLFPFTQLCHIPLVESIQGMKKKEETLSLSRFWTMMSIKVQFVRGLFKHCFSPTEAEVKPLANRVRYHGGSMRKCTAVAFD